MNATELCGDLPKPQASIWEKGRMMWFQFHTICPQISFTTRLVTDFGGESKCQDSGLLCISWKEPAVLWTSFFPWGSGPRLLPSIKRSIERPNESNVKPSGADFVSEWLGKRCQIALWAGEKTQATKRKGEDMLAFSTGGILYFFKKTSCMYLSRLCWVFVASLAFSGCGEQGLLFVVVCRLLTVVASLVAEHGL